MRKLLPAALLPLLLAACGEPNLPTCAGSIYYEGGLIRIDSAVLGPDAAPVPNVTISNLTTNGRAIMSYELTQYASDNGVQNIRVDGSTLVCGVACAFGTPDRYTFDVGAPGAVTQHVALNITPVVDTTLGHGCDGYYTGTPVHLNLKFTAAP